MRLLIPEVDGGLPMLGSAAQGLWESVLGPYQAAVMPAVPRRAAPWLPTPRAGTSLNKVHDNWPHALGVLRRLTPSRTLTTH